MSLLTHRIEARKCSCEFSKSIDDIDLMSMIPIEYKYAICEMEKTDSNYFQCKFRVNISTKDEALQWFEEFNFSSNTAYLKAKTYPDDTQGNVFKAVWKCIHSTKTNNGVKISNSRDTECPARLLITVKQMLSSKRYESKDIHLKDYPMVVTLRYIHNHDIEKQENLKFISPDINVQRTFLQYFRKGYLPAKAMDTFLSKVEKIHGNLTISDLKICPDERWVYHFYYRVFRNIDSEENVLSEDLEEKCIKKIVECNVPESTTLIDNIFENMSETSEILLVDSDGNIERISFISPSDNERNNEIDILATHNEKCKIPYLETYVDHFKSDVFKKETLDRLQATFDNIIDKVKNNDSMLYAATKFNNTYKTLSDESLEGALLNFGKCKRIND